MTENKLNRLERTIQNAEESAEDARWMQAEEVVRRLDRGETGAEVASSWTNLKTGKPYLRDHVTRCARIWRDHGALAPMQRPEWHKVYDTNSTTRSERMQSQPPKTIETALKLVENVMKSSPPQVQDTVFHELKLRRAGEDRTPAARKASEAAAEAAVAPARRVAGTLQGDIAIQAVKDAADGVREAIENDAVTPKWMRRMDDAVEELQAVLIEARFGLGADR